MNLSRRLLVLVCSALFLPLSGEARAQSVPVEVDTTATVLTGSDWNSPGVLELLDRARTRRQLPRTDSGLINYQASAAGYVYFFLDHIDAEESTLVRVDQLALEVYWAAPNRTKQRIVGMRDASQLPNKMRYHLDHLTVVQDEFGDLIRLGDGDEVRDVLHPAAPRSGDTYDFRLVDSLTIRLADSTEPIHVYEVEVRPRDTSQPAFIGSIFLDRRSAAIVRLDFTFTPASYVDRRLDYIRVGLDNGLWEGRYWLPHEQTLEIRRQVPILDFPAGSIIRGVMRISDYRFNQELPPTFFQGPRVVAVPRQAREAYDFPSGLFAELEAAGSLAEPIDPVALRRQVTRMIGRHYLSGLPKIRLYLPNGSAALRYNRAEALYLGGGLSYATGAESRLRVMTGFATGPKHLLFGGDWRLGLGGVADLRLRAEWNGLRELGLRPGLPGAFNTLTAAGFGEDYFDPYFVNGASLGVERRFSGGWRAGLTLGHERHRGAQLEEEHAILNSRAEFRSILPVAEGRLWYSRLELGRTTSRPSGWSGGVAIEAGRFGGSSYLRPILDARIRGSSGARGLGFELRGETGMLVGTAPPQSLFLFGGSATLPGYSYRGFVGDRFALLGFEAYRDLLAPWVRLRVLGAAGWADLVANGAPPPEWEARPTMGLETSLGAGIGIFYDLARIDLVRGLNRGGGWQWVVSVSPDIADFF